MIEKINKIIELQNELSFHDNIISVNKTIDGITTAIVYGWENFLKISDEDVEIKTRQSSDFPYSLTSCKDGVLFEVLLTETDYQEYKKATAVTVTKEKFDNL